MLELLEIKETQIYLICLIIFSILYLILYKYKGINQNIYGYKTAVKSCISYAIIIIFIIVGYRLILKIIEQGSGYWGIIIPIIWLLISIETIKRCIQKDFGFEIYKFDIRKYTTMIVFFTIKCAGIIAMVLCFWAAYDSIGNTFQVISLVVVGIIFGIVGNFLFNIFKNIQQYEKEKDEDK